MTARGRVAVGGAVTLLAVALWWVVFEAFHRPDPLPIDPVLADWCCPSPDDPFAGLAQLSFARHLSWTVLVLGAGGLLLLGGRSARALAAAGAVLAGWIVADTWLSGVDSAYVAGVLLMAAAAVGWLGWRQPPGELGGLVGYTGFAVPFLGLLPGASPGFGEAWPPLVRFAAVAAGPLVLAAAVLTALAAGPAFRRGLAPATGLMALLAGALFTIGRLDTHSRAIVVELAGAMVVAGVLALAPGRGGIDWVGRTALIAAVLLGAEEAAYFVRASFLTPYDGLAAAYADRRPWIAGVGLVTAAGALLVQAVLRRLPRPDPEPVGAGRRAIAIALAVVGAASWALWLAIYDPAVQDLRSFPALSMWVKDVRWASIVVGVGGLVLAAGGPRWRRTVLALVAAAWVGADVLLDRADVQGWPVAVAAFLGATAVLVSAILLGRGSGRPGPVAFVYSGVAIAVGCLVPLQFTSEPLPALPAGLGQAIGPLLVAAALAVALVSAPGLSTVRVGLAVVGALVAAAYTVSGPWLPESESPFGFYTQFLYHTQFDAIGLFVFALALATGRIGRRVRDVVTTVASGLVTIAGATAITYSLLLLVFYSQRWLQLVDEFVPTDQAPMTLAALLAGPVLAVLALAPRAFSSSSTPSTPSTSDEPPPSPTAAGPAAARAPEEELTAVAPAASAA